MVTAHCFVQLQLSIHRGVCRNLSLSLAAGNATLWKPSPTTPLSAIATTKIITRALERNGLPGAIAGLVCGDKPVGEQFVASSDIDMGEPFGSIMTSRDKNFILFLPQYLSPAASMLVRLLERTSKTDLARFFSNWAATMVR